MSKKLIDVTDTEVKATSKQSVTAVGIFKNNSNNPGPEFEASRRAGNYQVLPGLSEALAKHPVAQNVTPGWSPQLQAIYAAVIAAQQQQPEHSVTAPSV